MKIILAIEHMWVAILTLDLNSGVEYFVAFLAKICGCVKGFKRLR
jgi:hypothetical protein